MSLNGFRDFKMSLQTIGIKWDKNTRAFCRELCDEGYSQRDIGIAMCMNKERLIKAVAVGDFWIKFMQTISMCPSSHNNINPHKFYEMWRAYERNRRAVELTGQTILNGTPKLTECVYFIQGKTGGPIKIGYTTDLARRIKRLQYYYKQEFKLLALIPGTRKTEAEMHKKFGRYRLKGEWFRPTPKVLEKIQLLKEAS